MSDQSKSKECPYINNNCGLTTVPRDVFNSQRTLVDLSNNQLTSPINSGFSTLINLRRLNLSQNKLDRITPHISKLTTLVGLDFHGNSIKKMPRWICVLPNLTKLDVSHNKLSNLPAEIRNLAERGVDLNLNNNKLRFMPSELFSSKRIKFSGNYMVSVPKQLCDSNRLTYLDLSLNNITSIPKEFAKLTSLVYLDLSGNSISKIYGNDYKWEKLRYLDLSNNYLKSIPESIYESKFVRELHLEQNIFKRLPEKLISKLNCWNKLKYKGVKDTIRDILSKQRKITNVPYPVMGTQITHKKRSEDGKIVETNFILENPEVFIEKAFHLRITRGIMGNEEGYKWVAMKELTNTTNAPDDEIKKFRETCKIISKLDCENIVRHYDNFWSDLHIHLVQEYYPMHTLSDYLYDTHKCVDIPRDVLENFCLGITKGLKCIHENDLLHGNLTSKTVVLDENLVPKICDCGMSEFSTVYGSALSGGKGDISGVATQNWLPHEILNGDILKLNRHVDRYSLGVVFFEIWTKTPPFSEYKYMHSLGLLKKITKDKVVPKIPDDVKVPNKWVRLMKDLWSVNPLRRPKLTECIDRINNEDEDIASEEEEKEEEEEDGQAIQQGVCSECEIVESDLLCIDCDDEFCFDCWKSFHKRGNRKNHATEPSKKII